MEEHYNISDFDYYLPAELIAQYPSVDRTSSRLMVLSRKEQTIIHKHFSDIVEYLNSGDVLVVNETKVIPARLIGKRKSRKQKNLKTEKQASSSSVTRPFSSAKVEVFLLRAISEKIWEALVKPGKKAKIGDEIVFENSELVCKILEHQPDGKRIVELLNVDDVKTAINKIGQTPLPPYINRPPTAEDKERYQTVYAQKEGAVAAPTAGLHFSAELLETIKSKGVKVVSILLHIGLGTFKPVKVDDITTHIMDEEYYEVSQESADIINSTHSQNKKIIAVGTTTVRTLETVSNDDGFVNCSKGWTRKFIYPPYKFKVVDALITNFHLPKSTLIMLVSAFAGREFTLKAYNIAVQEKYRFYSYGDAMLIL